MSVGFVSLSAGVWFHPLLVFLWLDSIEKLAFLPPPPLISEFSLEGRNSTYMTGVTKACVCKRKFWFSSGKIPWIQRKMLNSVDCNVRFSPCKTGSPCVGLADLGLVSTR